MTLFNLNDYILVDLTDAGKKVYLNQLKRWTSMGCGNPDEVQLPDQENGLFEFQAWEFIQIFGPHLYMGMNPSLFDMNIKIKKVKNESADRWDALMKSDRIRVIGSAQLGNEHQHLGLELWETYPDIKVDSRDDLITYVDGIRKRKP